MDAPTKETNQALMDEALFNYLGGTPAEIKPTAITWPYVFGGIVLFVSGIAIVIGIGESAQHNDSATTIATGFSGVITGLLLCGLPPPALVVP
jgi:hypothetical protein